MSYSPGLLVSRWYIITGTVPSSFAFTLAGSGGLRLGDGLGVAPGIGVVKGVVAELKAQLQQGPQTPSLLPL